LHSNTIRTSSALSQTAHRNTRFTEPGEMYGTDLKLCS